MTRISAWFAGPADLHLIVFPDRVREPMAPAAAPSWNPLRILVRRKWTDPNLRLTDKLVPKEQEVLGQN